jgi:hypothetical protein
MVYLWKLEVRIQVTHDMVNHAYWSHQIKTHSYGYCKIWYCRAIAQPQIFHIFPNHMKVYSIGKYIVDRYTLALWCQLYQPNFTIDVAPCFVLKTNQSLIGILYNNGLCHSALFFTCL